MLFATLVLDEFLDDVCYNGSRLSEIERLLALGPPNFLPAKLHKLEFQTACTKF